MKKTNCIYKEENYFRVKKTYKKVKISFTKKTLTEAKKELKRRMKEIDDNILANISNEPDVKKKTLKDVFNEYVELKDIRWKKTTKKNNCVLFKTHFSKIMNIPISTLTDEHINKWIYEVSKINKNRIGNNLSDRPYRCAILMKAILEFGIKKQYCSSLLDLSFGNKVPQVTNVSEKTKNNYINYKDFLLLCEAIKKSERKEEKKIEHFLYFLSYIILVFVLAKQEL